MSNPCLCCVKGIYRMVASRCGMVNFAEAFMNIQKSLPNFALPGLCLAVCLLSGWQVASADEIVGGVWVGTAPSDECNPDEEGGKILEAAQKMTDATCESSAIVMSDRSGFFSQALKSQMSDKCTRIQDWVGAEHRKSDFAKSGKKNSADCYIAEIEGDDFGDDDGICARNEWYDKKEDTYGCMEEMGDGAGNENEICELVAVSPNGKKKVWEKCLEVCDTPADNPLVTDCTTMDLMTMSLEDAAGSLETANMQIEAKLAVLNVQQTNKVQSVNTDSTNNPCLSASDAVFDGRNYPYGAREDGYTNISAAITAALLLEQAGNTCTDAMDTSSFGFDFPVVCMVVHYGQQVAQSFAEQMELLDDAITGTRVDNMSLCLEQMGSQLDAMDEKLDLIINYLNMPQGQRPDFPSKP